MFAVPGWSVSASALKPQTFEGQPPVSQRRADNSHDEDSSRSTKKRKRSKSKAKEVTAANVVDLWEEYMEGKPRADKKSKGKRATTENKIDSVKQSLLEEKAVSDEQSPGNESAVAQPRVSQGGTKKVKNKSGKANKKYANLMPVSNEAVSLNSTAQAVSQTSQKHASSSNTKTTTTLTPLQTAMRQKLVSARFRHLNQTLYTTPSAQSLQLFRDNPEMFSEYHEGFRRQVDVWPENPVNSYLAEIQSRGAITTARRDASGDRASTMPLPRTGGICTLADLGCGDAALATALQSCRAQLRLHIHSFDLHAPSALVTPADMAHLPLKDGSVDVAIFCLALMGTNWPEFIDEAFRILRWKGELWVAEIKSRFGRGAAGASRIVEHSVGNRKRAVVPHDASGPLEDTGVQDQPAETDVSAFVEVLRRRGFILQGEGHEAINLQSKMFVRLNFIKAATPTVGKGVPSVSAQTGSERWQKKKVKGKFLDGPEPEAADEARVLKPCVYKLR
ncbi:unnamed protein product [Blumeria hordei]|uniref:Ribosomal RNA-processing protein 8 n=1 Tax=Blumeria hordei TaxID=2867405 RepID=A0A383ULP5_BLUHO|nr:unnamed protein product [Blumeria hordei]